MQLGLLPWSLVQLGISPGPELLDALCAASEHLMVASRQGGRLYPRQVSVACRG